MRQHLLRTACLWVVLLFCVLAKAQIASPYYTNPLDLTVDKAGVEAIVGNVLCYSDRREFPNGKKGNPGPDAATTDKTTTDLKIGGSYAGDYWTFVVNAPEAGLYKFEFGAAHAKDGDHTLTVAQSTDEITTVGETDADIAYTDVETLNMPNGNGNWHAKIAISTTMTLNKGYNYVKITFGGGSYCGNVDYLKVFRTYPPKPDFETVTLGGKSILDDLENADTYTINVPDGNPLPELVVTVNELAEVEVTPATEATMEATIKLYKKEGHELLKTYTIKYVYVGISEGYSFIWTTGDGTTDKTYRDGAYSARRISIVNPAFSVVGSNDVYTDNRFKIKTGEKFALRVPKNAVVNKVTFVNCYEAYYNRPEGSNLDSEWDYVKSEGATSIIAYDGKITEGKDIEVTFTNHQAGTPIEYSVKKCANVAFEKIIIEYAQINDHALNYVGSDTENGAEKNASGVVKFNFDRNITATETAKVTVDDESIRYQIKGSTLIAYYWDLTPSASHTLKIAANSVEDVFKNKYAEEIAVTFNTPAAKGLEMAKFDYVVGTAEELHAAIDAVNASNTSVDAPRKRIFIKNGDYVMDETLKYEEGSLKPAISLTAYNVSLIGQSEEGVLIRSLNQNDSQATAVLEVKNKGTYLQDLTIRTSDFRTEAFIADGKTSNGRLLTVYMNGGSEIVMKHVTLQSNQDTYLCGHRGYHEDCTIHGTVDFIYAGGDNLFKNNTIVMENGGVIGAPGTNSSQQWGLVFDGCTIKASNAVNLETAGDRFKYEGYSLARPWQGEPRCYWLNTTMEILPSDLGWRPMSHVITHFYEYHSMDASGKALDLSKRGNCEGSLNTYSPILTDAEVVEFTAHNILGGEDGWEPAKMTDQVAAPTVALTGNTLSWNAVENALGYVIYKNGEFLANTTQPSLDVTDAVGAEYAVAAANEMGGLSAASKAGISTGISETITDSSVVSSVYYNAQGQRIVAPAHGIVIRVDRMDDGSKKIVKVNY